MDKKEIRQYSRMAYLGLKETSKMLNPYTYIISLVILIITVGIITTSITKWGEINQQSIKIMKKKYVDREVIVKDTVWQNDCDTVYIIDGVKFTKAGG